MTAAVVAGVGLAAGICLLISGLAPRPEPLERALARLGQPTTRPDTNPAEAGDDLDARLGRWLRRSQMIDRAVATLGTDLRILGRSPDHQVAQLVAYALVGLFWAPVVTAGCLLLGVRIPLAYLLTGAGYGLFGAWVAMVADIWVRGLFFAVRFAGGRWKKIEV